MIIPLCQYNRRTSLSNGLDHLAANELIPILVTDQFAIEFLKLHSHVRIALAQRPKVGRAYNHEVFKGARRRLLLGIDAVTNGSALHEDDRVVAIFTRY